MGTSQEPEVVFAKKFVYRRLAAKNYSSFELRKLLQDRQVSESTINRIVGECQSMGYINDREWIEGYIRRQIDRNNGPKVIALKLKAKHVPDQLIDEYREKYDNPQLQRQRILHLLKTRYRSRDLNNYKEKQKVIAACMRKGFDLQYIYEVMGGKCEDETFQLFPE